MKNLNAPIVSIIMPTFNRANVIGMAIKSVIDQTLKEWELLVIDNGSIDNTGEVVNCYCTQDSRIKYFNIPKSKKPGIADYLNFGIQNASGKYIARLDDDDKWCDSEKLNKQVTFLEQNIDYVLVGGGAIVIDNKQNELYRFFKRETDTDIRRNALYANPFVHSNVLFRKSTAQELGGYKNIRFGEDWELWLRLGKKGKLYNFKEYFLFYLSTDQNYSVNNQRFVGKTILGLIKEYKNDYPNYWKAFLLNFMQYAYSFSPAFIKKRTQNYLFYVKRNYF